MNCPRRRIGLACRLRIAMAMQLRSNGRHNPQLDGLLDRNSQEKGTSTQRTS